MLTHSVRFLQCSFVVKPFSDFCRLDVKCVIRKFCVSSEPFFFFDLVIQSWKTVQNVSEIQTNIVFSMWLHSTWTSLYNILSTHVLTAMKAAAEWQQGQQLLTGVQSLQTGDIHDHHYWLIMMSTHHFKPLFVLTTKPNIGEKTRIDIARQRYCHNTSVFLSNVSQNTL